MWAACSCRDSIIPHKKVAQSQILGKIKGPADHSPGLMWFYFVLSLAIVSVIARVINAVTLSPWAAACCCISSFVLSSFFTVIVILSYVLLFHLFLLAALAFPLILAASLYFPVSRCIRSAQACKIYPCVLWPAAAAAAFIFSASSFNGLNSIRPHFSLYRVIAALFASLTDIFCALLVCFSYYSTFILYSAVYILYKLCHAILRSVCAVL